MAFSTLLLPTTLPSSDRSGPVMPPPVWWPIARTSDHIRPLTRERCRQLLAGADRGWLSYPQQPGAPSLAAAYRLDGEALLISFEAAAAPRTASLVLFRVDHVDAERRHGWTVVASGSLRRSEADVAAAWPAGQETGLRLELAHLAGRWVAAAPRDGHSVDGA